MLGERGVVPDNIAQDRDATCKDTLSTLRLDACHYYYLYLLSNASMGMPIVIC